MAGAPLQLGSTPPDAWSDSYGIMTYRVIPSDTDTIAQDMSQVVTNMMFETVISNSRPPTQDGQVSGFQEQLKKLQAQLDGAKEDLEFATLKEEELQSRNRQAQQAAQDLKDKVNSLTHELQEARNKLAQQAQEHNSIRRELDIAQTALQQKQTTHGGDLEVENSSLRAKVAVLEKEVLGLQNEFSQRQMVSSTTTVPGTDYSGAHGASQEESPMLSAAYQQISLLNTQLAHLYTELTIARTEAASLRSERDQHSMEDGSLAVHAGASGSISGADAAAESQKQAQQIADLVSDIRHLQLDLEYHQQKVDQLLEDKQESMKDLKRQKAEIEQAKKDMDEKEQLLKHQEVDLQHYRQLEEAGHFGGIGNISASDDGMLDALRSEAAAKDSALIVSHYELHKEKLLRDRLEQKNMKLMERMQKLMMVVETMRKDNINLERTLASRERLCEDKETQLRAVMQKARQLQRSAKAAKQGVNVKKAPAPLLELGSSMQSLPPLDGPKTARDGRTSGRTTPQRTPRGGSAYTSR
eukprot:TRINITY_DN50583_c0_g1_i1.p1 TRINITY_DN50583_c0_g1~~TRINITY_DN50583_c0_g1_i1.p1  ORF type:complete len:526 (+),score=141.43 TRINITY_DN50583_c0_g1_i1:68-1645(+)